MIHSKFFSSDYSTARQRFREAASRLGWQLEAHSIGIAGPDGQDLTLDIACSEDIEPSKAVVVSSGVHGVEGFLGSAVQWRMLEHWASHSAPPLRYVFLHGLNPYGFAWLRRFDENNVDPNRNFLLPGEQYEGVSAGYAELDALLNPRRPPSRLEPFTVKALWSVAKHGMPALRQAIAEGQYAYPQGLFFGGSRPSRTHELLRENFGRWLHGATHVVHLDFHTGLGRMGQCKLLIDDPLTPKDRGRLADWFGPDSFEASDSRGIAYKTHGGFGRWCVNQGLAADYVFATAEFGTYGPIQVLAGLRAENQAHHWGASVAATTLRTKQNLKQLFCPDNADWHRRTLERSFELVTQASLGLTEIRG